MIKGRKLAVMIAAAVLMSTVPTTAFGAVITYNSGLFKESDKSDETSIKDLIESGKMKLEDIAEMGPGYAAAITEQIGAGLTEAIEEEETDYDGPVVKKVNLGERYHADYKTYELSMADLFFMYANVGNGGITHEPVAIDIPANISYTMEKDGLPYEYVSQSYISAKGTYVMKLTGIEDKELPLSEQVEYQAVFRFRITDEPPVEETEAEEETVSVSAGGSIFGNTEIPVIGMPETKPAAEDEMETEPVEETTAAEPETKAETESASETVQEITPEDPADHAVGSEREQSFELATGNYIITLENGKKITTNVPEGYIGTGTVYLEVEESDVSAVTLYKNDEPVEFVNSNSVSEYGRYRLEVDGCSYFFTLAYEVGQMDYYPAPTGMDFLEVSLNGEEVDLESDQYVKMEADGTYVIAMKGDHGERYEVTLLKDTIAPEITVTTTKSAAAIQYLSGDIEIIELVRNGEPVSGFNSTSVTDPGNYTLTVSDKAGNSTSASFNLKYRVNIYGVLAVALVILSIAGIGAFVVYTKKNTKVR